MFYPGGEASVLIRLFAASAAVEGARPSDSWLNLTSERHRDGVGVEEVNSSSIYQKLLELAVPINKGKTSIHL